ncbi:PREDICTED: coiled-coil and C2 domain-containing protein 2A-like [Amphimedon queenslandica]|uniref:Uncharacterized protein n=1 Tax=Amphimedon queenslandica TaxID=400682 RepID=A0AAN0JUB3_AMPQE|nr:PREDICTED: coiled-coil and C2 domain-containing protein 2A-like [Amphimedon queenslandica]|eukprot:XP_019860650.1 PREDICTED: coiled-coil and C2 domain-containing protein 2A-like [Amphimedon queenslandica]
MLGGDKEEHAVLLCNYFLFLGQRAWLVLGTKVIVSQGQTLILANSGPARLLSLGPTAYVLTLNPVSNRSYILWNPSNGKHFPYNLSHIPLHSIGCLINSDNVWGNIQEWDHPSRVTFDLQNSKKWSPLFPSTMNPLDSIQVDTLEYSETNSEQVQQLRTRIDRLVHDHIEQLREHDLTRWNRLCCRVLHRLSSRLEEKPFSSSETSQLHKRELKESLPGYKITGYPLHIKYSDTAQLLRAVESTGLHLCHHRRIEFAMYVTVHSYPNDILSVWIYLATVTPPDTN